MTMLMTMQWEGRLLAKKPPSRRLLMVTVGRNEKAGLETRLALYQEILEPARNVSGNFGTG
jgi:hypothetical protein